MAEGFYKNMKKSVPIRLAAGMLAAAVLFSGCGKTEEVTATAIEVDTITPETKDIAVEGSFIGKIITEGKVSVYPKISAQVVKRNFKAGDHVKQGDVLFVLDDRELRIDRTSAQAGLQSANASLTAQKITNEATKAEANETLGTMPTEELKLDMDITNAQRSAETAWNEKNQAEYQEDLAKQSEKLLKESRTGYQQEAATQKEYVKSLEEKRNTYNGISTASSVASARDLAVSSSDGKLSAAEVASLATANDVANLWLKTVTSFSDTNDLSSAIEFAKQAVASAESSAKSVDFSETALSMTVAQNSQKAASLNAAAAADAKRLAEQLKQDYENFSKARIQAGVNAQLAEGDAAVEGAEAQLVSAQATLDAANLKLESATVTAPVSGIISEVNITEKSMATDQQAAYVIENLDGKKVRFYVSESVKNVISPGQTVKIEKDSATIEGTVDHIADIPDDNKSLFAIDAVLPESDAASFVPGTSIKLTTTIERAEGVLTLPIGAVYYNEGKAYVYLAKGATAVKADIETGLSDDTSIQILSGITAEDKVITSWSSQLRDQAKIKVKKPSENKAEDGGSKATADTDDADKDGADKTGSDKDGSDKTGAEKDGSDKDGADKTGAEKDGSDKTGAEKDGSEAADKAPKTTDQKEELKK